MLSRWFGFGSAVLENGDNDESVPVREDVDENIFADMIEYDVSYCREDGRPFRILCLHGRGSNSDITAIQMVGLGLQRFVEIDCLNGAIPDRPNAELFKKLSDRSFRTWWRNANEFEMALKRVLAVIRDHGPFDGLYGFSMGASLVTALSTPGVLQALHHTKTPPWSFLILAGAVSLDHGFLPDLLNCGLPLPQIDLPSLHIIGRRDPYRASSDELMTTRYNQHNVQAVYHDYAHEVPIALRQDAHFSAQVHSFLRNLSPSQSSASTTFTAPSLIS